MGSNNRFTATVQISLRHELPQKIIPHFILDRKQAYYIDFIVDILTYFFNIPVLKPTVLFLRNS